MRRKGKPVKKPNTVGNDAIVHQFLLVRGPHGAHLCASLQRHADTRCLLEAIDMTMCYITQEEPI